MSTQQAASSLRVTYAYILQLLRSGRLTGTHDPITGRWSVDPESVERYARERRKPIDALQRKTTVAA